VSPRTWLNLALAAAVLVLAAVALLQPGIERTPEAPRLTDLAPASVTRVRIDRQDQPAVVLEKRDGSWYLTEPLALPANGFRIQTLLEVLESRVDRPVDTGAVELSRLGLDPPRATLTLDDLRIDFGDTESLSGRRYVRVAERVSLLFDRFYHQLAGPAAGFVSLHPLGAAVEPEVIELPDLTLRREGGRWRAEPDDGRQDADAIAQMVEAWTHSQAITVRAHEPPAGEVKTVTVTLRGGDAPLRFAVEETPSALVLARPDVGVQYHLPLEAADRMLRLAPPSAGGPGRGQPLVDPLEGDAEAGEEAAAEPLEGAGEPPAGEPTDTLPGVEATELPP
jgi:hypothetical protein